MAADLWGIEETNPNLLGRFLQRQNLFVLVEDIHLRRPSPFVLTL